MTRQQMAGLLTALKLAAPRWAPQQINLELAGIWIDVLQDFDDITVAKTISKAMQNLTEWPTPATIKRMCMGTDQTDEEIGAEVSTRIAGAIGRAGYSNSNLAEEIIGPIGWEVVRLCGGWTEICGIESYDQMPSYKKQWREIGVQVSKKLHQHGRIDAPKLPELPEKSLALAQALRIAEGRA